MLEIEPEPELDARDNKKYEVNVIYDSKVYIKETAGQLLRLYYLIF